MNPTVGPHSLGFEVQSLPLQLGLFHLGGYANRRRRRSGHLV